MSTEGKMLVGLTVGGALIIGTLPELLVGMAAGYVVYICHKKMVTAEADEALKVIEGKLADVGEDDKNTKAKLEALREKVQLKKDVAAFGSSVIALGSTLCPPAGIAYLVARYAYKKKEMEAWHTRLQERIDAVRRPRVATS